MEKLKMKQTPESTMEKLRRGGAWAMRGLGGLAALGATLLGAPETGIASLMIGLGVGELMEPQKLEMAKEAIRALTGGATEIVSRFGGGALVLLGLLPFGFVFSQLKMVEWACEKAKKALEKKK